MDDLTADCSVLDVDALQQIHRRKTGALLTVALVLGGTIARAQPDSLKSLRIYGKEIGLAFQIVDDLLDLRGEEDKIGKRTGKDSEQGKLTYPAALGVKQSEELARQKADAAISAIRGFGTAADPLILFANFVVNRSQ